MSSDDSNAASWVVGIGGSAGGLPALMTLLESLGGDLPIAIVVVLHLAPDHESSAAEILQRVTPMIVTQVRSRVLLQSGRIYVIAPGTNLITEDGHVQPADLSNKHPSSVIDLFFRSLGEVHRERSVGIVLSGTGRDGALGLRHINECGGLSIVQAFDECEHDDMPKAAVATGCVDLVLPAAEIGRRLVEIAKSARSTASKTPMDETTGLPIGEEPSGPSSAEDAVRDILAALRVRTRHDFRHYKRATLLRRLERRVHVHSLGSIQAYRDYVRKNPEELEPLLSDMLISVTNFFRDPRAFEALENEVIPQLMEAAGRDEEVRVWVAACASGEESYSIAILLQEFADRMAQPPRLQIFASDINEAALNIGRAGIYPANIEVDIPQSRLLSFFERELDGNFRVRSSLRESIVFARHNVLGDPPFSRVDLICCRNLLIYLDRTAQAAVLDMFAYALKPGGYLFLGNAESIEAANPAFEIVSKEHRIYRLSPGAAASLRLRIPSQMTSPPIPSASSSAGQRRGDFDDVVQEHSLAALHERAVLAAALPSVLIDAAYDLERVSNGAGRFVAFGEGVPTRNLLNNVPADIRVELRAALFQAGETRRPVRVVFRRKDGPSEADGPIMALSVHPVEDRNDGPDHWLVLFDEPVEDNRFLSAGGDAVGAEEELVLRRLEGENRSLKSHLQDTLDRSAISNEELKASNEELQAINEELRSAKEELETSKEELQSVNEELTTVNFELQMKVEEAGRHNDDLRNLIEASGIATVFVDSGMRVKRFTPEASKLFALIPSDIGRPLMDVKSRLQYDEMVDDATASFNQLRMVERSVTSISGEKFLARVLPYRTSQDKIGGAVLTFVDMTKLHLAENRVKLSEERLRDAIGTSKDFAVISADAGGKIVTWNEGAQRIFGYEPAEILGQMIDELYTKEDRAADVPADERRTAMRDGRASDERWHLRRDGTTFYCSGVMTPLHGSGSGYLKIARDLSVSKGVELQQRDALRDEQRSSAEARTGSELKDRFLAVMSHELKQPLNLIQVNAELLTRLPEVEHSPAVRRIGDTIMRAVSAQETIVNDLLDLSRIQTGKMRLQREPIDLSQLVSTLSAALASDVSRKGIELHVSALPDVRCFCDPVRIEQVVWNLLGNAVKFTPENGHINATVSTDRGLAKIEVVDTGVGIPAQFLPRVFELFSQGMAESGEIRRGGLGIGLALVKELVQAHGGRVEATSPGLGQGSTFTVWIPLCEEASLPKANAPAPSLSHRRILLVDDDPDSLETFATLLGLEGAVVDTADSGAEALTMLQSGDYELLLSDIGMPEMSGIELIKRARDLSPRKAFRSVAITGYGSDADARHALAAGFDAHVSKPISLERLQEVLNRL